MQEDIEVGDRKRLYCVSHQVTPMFPRWDIEATSPPGPVVAAVVYEFQLRSETLEHPI